MGLIERQRQVYYFGVPFKFFTSGKEDIFNADTNTIDQTGLFKNILVKPDGKSKHAVFLASAVLKLAVVYEDLENIEGVVVVRTKFCGLRLFYDLHGSVGARQVSFDAGICAFRRIMSKIAREQREN